MDISIPEGWQLAELGKLGKFSKGKGILKDQVQKEGLPCIRYGEIYTKYSYVAKDLQSFISKDIAKESQKIACGDVLFAGSGETIEEIGKSVVYLDKQDAFAGGDIIILSPSYQINPEYLSYLLEIDIVKKQKRRLGQGNSVVHIYASDLKSLLIPLPSLLEQKEIASIFRIMDDNIATINQLISKKELQKKALMQQLLTGKKRINRFSGKTDFNSSLLTPIRPEWKVKTLAELCSMFKSGFGITAADIAKFGLYLVYGGNGIRGYTTKFTHDGKYILIGRQGALCGNIELIEGKNYVSEHAIAIQTNNENELAFLYYKLILLNLNRFSEASAQPGLSVEKLLKLKLTVPSQKEEQAAISQILTIADKEIQLLKAKADKLKEQKKGMMQLLLTGKKRLKIIELL